MQRYALSSKAKADLKEIARYTQAQFGREQRLRYLAMLDATFERLAEDPTKGRDFSEVRSGYRAQPAGSHLVVFRKSGKRVEIIRILHQSMDIEGRLTDA